MNRSLAARLLLALPAVLALGACVGPQPGGSLARMERPVSEMPVGKDEARGKAKVHVELGQAYFQVGRYGVALDEAKAAPHPGRGGVRHGWPGGGSRWCGCGCG